MLQKKFLRKYLLKIEDEQEFYRSFRDTLIDMEFWQKDVLYETGKGGMQQIDGEWVYVGQNGSIKQDGFHPEIYSGVEGGAYILEKMLVGTEEIKKIIAKLFQQFSQSPNIFYPLFLLSIMAVTCGYFRENGEADFMRLTAWLDGASGSGKTELAKAAGNFFFQDERKEKAIEPVTAGGRYILERLSQSSGVVFILDDVKKEQTRERRNSVADTVDDVLRSVYQGKMTNVRGKKIKLEKIDCCGLITGEYLDTTESQNARLIYLRVDGFLKNPGNSRALRVIQKNPIWLASVGVWYIQWFLRKAEESSFQSLVDLELEALRKNLIPILSDTLGGYGNVREIFRKLSEKCRKKHTNRDGGYVFLIRRGSGNP
ncbi:MAG: hypothetical protein OSJ52_10655 [Lachnospiraceae bacterium]|nr:hypothetical protein [Lachnospiraceae bacterium]